jgi:hypothetical protein
MALIGQILANDDVARNHESAFFIAAQQAGPIARPCVPRRLLTPCGVMLTCTTRA